MKGQNNGMTRHAMYVLTLRCVHTTTVAMETQLSTKHSASICILVFVIQHAKCMRCIISSDVACPTLPYFYTLSHKQPKFF